MGYKIYCTMDHLSAIARAAELYARVGMGQLNHVLYCDAFIDIHGDAYSELRELLDKASAILRNAMLHKSPSSSAKQLLDVSSGIATDTNRSGIRGPAVDRNRRIAWDIYQVVRQFVAYSLDPEGGFSVCFSEPMITADVPLVAVTADDDQDDRRPAKVRMADELAELAGCPPDDFATALSRIRAWKDAYDRS